MPADVRFCKICGALMEGNYVNRFIRENVTNRLSIIYRPIVLCVAISAVLYWAGLFLRHQELIRWAWMGMSGVPLLIMIWFMGSKVFLHRRTSLARKEYVVLFSLFVILPIALLIYTILVFLGLLPFPDISFGF